MKHLPRQKICTILFEESSNYMLKENNSAIKLFHNCQPSLICKVQEEGLVINSSLGFLMFCCESIHEFLQLHLITSLALKDVWREPDCALTLASFNCLFFVYFCIFYEKIISVFQWYCAFNNTLWQKFQCIMLIK